MTIKPLYEFDHETRQLIVKMHLEMPRGGEFGTLAFCVSLSRGRAATHLTLFLTCASRSVIASDKMGYRMQ